MIPTLQLQQHQSLVEQWSRSKIANEKGTKINKKEGGGMKKLCNSKPKNQFFKTLFCFYFAKAEQWISERMKEWMNEQQEQEEKEKEKKVKMVWMNSKRAKEDISFNFNLSFTLKWMQEIQATWSLRINTRENRKEKQQRRSRRLWGKKDGK